MMMIRLILLSFPAVVLADNQSPGSWSGIETRLKLCGLFTKDPPKDSGGSSSQDGNASGPADNHSDDAGDSTESTNASEPSSEEDSTEITSHKIDIVKSCRGKPSSGNVGFHKTWIRTKKKSSEKRCPNDEYLHWADIAEQCDGILKEPTLITYEEKRTFTFYTKHEVWEAIESFCCRKGRPQIPEFSGEITKIKGDKKRYKEVEVKDHSMTTELGVGTYLLEFDENAAWETEAIELKFKVIYAHDSKDEHVQAKCKCDACRKTRKQRKEARKQRKEARRATKENIETFWQLSPFLAVGTIFCIVLYVVDSYGYNI